MRALFSIAGLLLALFVVWHLAGRQVETAVNKDSGQKTADQTAAKIQNAMEQAASARASAAGQ